MYNDSELEHEIITRLRQAVAEAEQRGYERGVRETMDKIQNLVMSGARIATSGVDSGTTTRDADIDDNDTEGKDSTVHERKRAPKGLVRKVVKRALTARPGLTPAEIEATAQDDLEKMIRASSYRSELRKGRESGLYREYDGKWFQVEEEKAEDSRSSMPSAFGIATERG
jgi:hypothetical protein